jgi:hypothetical protein
MIRLLRAILALSLLAASPAFAQSMQFSTPRSWGQITGTLSNQTDLNTALAGKAPTTTAPVVLCQSGAQVSVSGTAAETQVYSCAIPAMGANGRLKIEMEGTFSGSTAARTINIYFGGTLVLTHAPASSSVVYVENAWVSNRNATNSQRAKGTILTASNGISAASGNSAIDTTSATTLAVKLQLNASDSGTLETISVVYYPAS